MAVAELDVDTDNPTGAHHLYASLGYVPVHGARMHTIDLGPSGRASSAGGS
jgi:hypothetical protein